ncbi:hypothetical protein [Sphingobacterium sp. JUb56]|uniref:hypothetical protein n=1 Tax=Sphingobacterium sp. JUb56 TaxID=2587145 RepID=UPI001618EC80|nr:hypothetical protein [Sphingobacterium sp. JUb56]MBB2952156.1 transcriptional regulator GlxA family with amidase domain [Sphingobacterium sp. JUb56]
MDKKNIAILILPDVQLLDVAGPTDVFHTANEILKKSRLWRTLSASLPVGIKI